MLRESGFIQVEMTGKSGDGGIDGRGIVKLGSVLSFHVHFQCKRFKDTVTSPVIREFRGAMVGRADKGMVSDLLTFSMSQLKIVESNLNIGYDRGRSRRSRSEEERATIDPWARKLLPLGQ